MDPNNNMHPPQVESLVCFPVWAAKHQPLEGPSPIIREPLPNPMAPDCKTLFCL
ncbi:hypothetical protein SLEP1_g27918 [Rubroshorea leprosula]|uniref:Uncharacterized protein n=1 Tax=Rubroshorea leprosula TaxID=152421 RepID=A0AAV5K1L7_9ROSI|nr:hypothetical protein SLEP1_g27918 [Rubroshorea leprosula]